MNDGDKQWLASAVDGEGTLVISKHSFEIRVYNRSKPYAAKASKLMYGTLCKTEYRPSRYIYTALCSKRMDVLKILKQIEPYLVVKRRKAISMIRTILDYYDIADIVPRAYDA